MKKLFFPLFILLLIFTSCKKDEPVLGTVTVSPTSVNLTYKQTVDIVPTFSQVGIAKDKQYTWKTDNDTIASVATVLGGNGRVTANRVGSTIITYAATDGSLSAKSTITVDPRSKIIGNIYFKKGADKSVVLAQEVGSENLSESTGLFFVFDRTPTSTVKIIRVIYQFDSNNKLVASYAALEDNTTNRTLVQQYLEERFELTSTIKNQISYYKADVGPLYMFETNTMIGAFIDNNPNTGLPSGLTYALGVKIVDKSNM
ncbi:exported hypothetical protein [uncultured Paludibacter sp.]|nr:exported hypothetical protein [uncultured Paludibacter sp.]